MHRLQNQCFGVICFASAFIGHDWFLRILRHVYPYDLNGLRSACDPMGTIIDDLSASRRKHMETFVPSAWGGQRHTIWVIGKVLFRSMPQNAADAWDTRFHLSETWRRPIADHDAGGVADRSQTVKIIRKPGFKALGSHIPQTYLDIAAGNAWDTFPTYENIRHRH